MPRSVEIRSALLTRYVHNGETLCFTTPHLPRAASLRCRLTCIRPEHVPVFEGDRGWFDLELVRGRPPYWRALGVSEPAESKSPVTAARETRKVLLKRARYGELTLHFTSKQLATKGRRSRVGFVSREHVLDFEGEEAWFEVERVPAKPRSYWRAVRRIEPPAAVGA